MYSEPYLKLLREQGLYKMADSVPQMKKIFSINAKSVR